jgi:hypothetical protein
MITLRWAQYPEADVALYRVYRSIIGFRAPAVAPATMAGLTLQLKMNGGSTQTITFSGSQPLVDQINAVLTGGRAYGSLLDSGYFFVRSDLREAPGTVVIVGGTALSLLGLTARTISQQSEDTLVSTIAAPVDPDEVVEFEDSDGALQDFYALTTSDSVGNESLKTSYRQPVASTGKLCVIEGIVSNLQGVRMVDAEVKATLVKFPHSPETANYITLEPITTLTGPDGRFSLALLQGAIVQLDISALGYSHNIQVPEKAFALITDLEVELRYRYPLNTEV